MFLKKGNSIKNSNTMFKERIEKLHLQAYRVDINHTVL